MYAVSLGQSHFPPQQDMDLHDSTVGEVLRHAAARWPGQQALVEALLVQQARTATADEAPAANVFSSLRAGESAVVFLSGSDPRMADAAIDQRLQHFPSMREVAARQAVHQRDRARAEQLGRNLAGNGFGSPEAG